MTQYCWSFLDVQILCTLFEYQMNRLSSDRLVRQREEEQKRRPFRRMARKQTKKKNCL